MPDAKITKAGNAEIVRQGHTTTGQYGQSDKLPKGATGKKPRDLTIGVKGTK